MKIMDMVSVRGLYTTEANLEAKNLIYQKIKCTKWCWWNFKNIKKMKAL